MLKRFFIVILFLVAIVGIGDWLLTTWAEGAMERHLKNEVGGASHVEIDSWPVMTRAVLSETIDEMSIELRNATIEGVDVALVRIELQGISVNRARIFRRQIDGVDLRNGTVTAAMTKEDLATLAGVSSESFSTEEADVAVENGRLLVAGQDVGAFPQDILPCSGTAQLTEDAVQFSCEVDGVPAIVTRNLPR